MYADERREAAYTSRYRDWIEEQRRGHMPTAPIVGHVRGIPVCEVGYQDPNGETVYGTPDGKLWRKDLTAKSDDLEFVELPWEYDGPVKRRPFTPTHTIRLCPETGAVIDGVSIDARRKATGEFHGLADEIEDVKSEAMRQNKKWGEQNHDDGKWALILLEELGEAAKDMLESNPEAADKELIESAAVILQWISCRRRNRKD
jgi:hypothetical protein